MTACKYGVVLLSIVLLQFSAAIAQPLFTIVCDASFERFKTLRPFPGVSYRVLLEEAPQTLYQLERVTPQGTDQQVIPLHETVTRKVYPLSVSPDGRYLVFAPREHNIPLVIWKVDTGEIAELPLSEADIDYLNLGANSVESQRNKLRWTDNTHLLLRYFDLDYQWFNFLLAEKLLTVIDTPFEIEEGVRTEVVYPDLPLPPHSSFGKPIFSPNRSYVTLVSLYLYTRLQIYDNRTQPPNLIIDLESDNTRGILSNPIWTPNEKTFFANYRITSSSEVKFGVARADADQNFQLSDSLQPLLEANLGTGTTLIHPFITSINSNGTKLVTRVFVPQESQEYLVVYHINTGDVTAICDDGEMTKLWYPIWGPNDEYFGFWDNGWVIAYHLETGEGYRMNGIGFVGWTEN